MAVALKGANDDKSTNSMIARSMGMGKPSSSAGPKTPAPVNPGHNVAPKSSKLPPMPTAEAVQMGLPSALAALKAHRDGPPKEEVPAPMIQSKTHTKKNADDEEEKPASDDDDDEEFGFEGDTSAAIAMFREKRLAELKQQNAKVAEFNQLGHGGYVEIKEEEFLPTVTKSKYAVVHFYHNDFERCKIVDKHLTALSREHIATKFAKLNAEKAPFFIAKLAVKVLPTVIMFKDGIAVDKIVGFEDFGTDDFKTELMARRIAKKGIIVIKKEAVEKQGANSIRSANNNSNAPLDSDEDEEEDR